MKKRILVLSIIATALLLIPKSNMRDKKVISKRKIIAKAKDTEVKETVTRNSNNKKLEKKIESKKQLNLSNEEIIQQITDLELEIKTGDYIVRANRNELSQGERVKLANMLEQRNQLLDLKMKLILSQQSEEVL